MPLDVQISLGSSTPIYWQIIDQVCRATTDGRLKPGDQLPSVRALAEKLVINPNTVARAYSELQREGVVEAQRGRGLFVAERRSIFSLEERRRRLDQALDVFLHEVRVLGLSAREVVAALDEKLPGLVDEVCSEEVEPILRSGALLAKAAGGRGGEA